MPVTDAQESTEVIPRKNNFVWYMQVRLPEMQYANATDGISSQIVGWTCPLVSCETRSLMEYRD